jgi:hypothetical protein
MIDLTNEPSVQHSCGIIMPISAFDGYTAEHWSDVKSIIQEAVEGITNPKFSARLVSEADDVGIIHKRIVQGVYTSDIVVCDVSGKNANVMFELGLRLAFDKPTIIIKDDRTDYSFDTSVIEHIPYPRDLRFGQIVSFKKMLADKVLATVEAAKNPDHSTFLKSFGTFTVARLEQKEASAQELMIDAISDLRRDIRHLSRIPSSSKRNESPIDESLLKALIRISLEEQPGQLLEVNDQLINRLASLPNMAENYSSRESFTAAVDKSCRLINKAP